MIVRLALALSLAAALAVLTALFRNLSGSVDALSDRLAASSADLDSARRDVVRLLDQNRRDVDARLARDVAGLHRDVLGPSLQVSAQGGGVGGGTILSTSGGGG